PCSQLCPWLGRSRPASRLSSVVLPEPERPTMARLRPVFSARSMPSSMVSAPSGPSTRLPRPRAWIIVPAIPSAVSAMPFRIRVLLWLRLWPGAAAFAQASPQTIVVLGDSLSAAHGMPVQAGWVALLAQRLDETGGKARVVNASISGETTAGGLARLPALLAEHRPALVLVQLGANDGLRGLPIAQIRSNLEAIIDQAKAEQA